MRKIINVTAILCFLLLSCGKYEDGPEFTLLTKKARLTGTWKYIKLTKKDGSVNLITSDEKLKIESNGTATIYSGSITNPGIWMWIEDKESLFFTFSVSSNEVAILRLTNSELKYQEESGNIKEYEKE